MSCIADGTAKPSDDDNLEYAKLIAEAHGADVAAEYLKPFELTLSATPAELRDWEEQFKAFYELRKCYEQSLLVQNVFVGKCSAYTITDYSAKKVRT